MFAALRPTPGRHLYAFLSGAIMCWVAYGTGSSMLVLPIVWTYALLRVLPRAHVGIVSMVLNLSYLVYCHTFTGSAEVWREGGIDATGSLMVITLKLIACCYTYQVCVKAGRLAADLLHGDSSPLSAAAWIERRMAAGVPCLLY